MEKKWIVVFFVLGAVALSGCVTDPVSGETDFLGFIPVSETTVAAAEVAAERASESGSALGIAGTLVASAIALWRRRKELEEKSAAERAKVVAQSVIAGAEKILSKAESEGWNPTRAELAGMLKEEQEKAGTRADVNELRKAV